MKLKYIFAVGVMALLASCDESRFLDIKPQGTLNDDLLSSADGAITPTAKIYFNFIMFCI